MASSMICGVLTLGVVGAAAAQTAAPADTAVQEVVVTGTRIQQPNMTSISPVTTVSNADIKLSGVTRIEDLINSLPQAFAGQGSAIGNGADGTATVNLRGLGVQRSLVLIDGRRLMPGSPAYSNNAPVPDLNFIPTALVDRVDVLTGGASATYGSDAVGGVVNFIMQKNFTGIKLDANAGFYFHDNTNTMMQGLEKARGFNVPTGTKADGWQKDVTLTLGVNAPDGKGNAEVYMGYRQIDAVNQGQRDYSACTIAESGAGFACGGSGTTALSHFLVFTPAGAQVGDPNGYILDPTGPGNTVRVYSSARDAFNYAPFNYYQRPDTRYTAGVLSHYELNEHADIYAQAMFMDDHSVSQAAPSGVFGQTVLIPCNSSLLSAQEVATFCTAAGQGPTGTATLALLKRNVEGGPRLDDLRHTDYRLVIGSKGEIDKNWNYDVYAQYGTAIFTENFTHDFSLLRSGNALASCANFADSNCVAYNAFAIGGVTPQALDYVSATGAQSGSTVEQVVSANLSAGDLSDYGLKSPWSKDAFGIAVGAEYRREQMSLFVDDNYRTGDLAGQGGKRGPVAGVYDVKELFTELNAPLAGDMPGIQSLSLNVGYRYSDYSSAGRTDTYKIGGEWAPVSDIKFRAGYNRAVRAPNLNELYAASGVVLDGSIDPCAGTKPSASAAACAKTGVTAAQYGTISANSANQYNGLEGGNPNLLPEKSDTFTVGFLATPRFIPGFNFSIDYFDIKVNNVIGTAGADFIITQCVQSGDPFYCSKIKRATNGSLWLGTTGYIEDTNFNLGSEQTKGLDFVANYRLPMAAMGVDRFGRVDVAFQGTLLNSFVTQTVPGGTTYDCVGYYGTVCDTATGGAPAPKFRAKTRVSWSTPWYGIQTSASWRHLDSVVVDSSSSNPSMKGTVNPADAKLPAFDYFDLSASIRLKDRYTLRLGVNNLMDLQPPLVGTGHLAQVYGNGNTYPGTYDPMGRYVFMGITAQF